MTNTTPYPKWAAYRVSKLAWRDEGLSLPYYYLPEQVDRGLERVELRRDVGRLTDVPGDLFRLVKVDDKIDKYSAHLHVNERVDSLRPVAEELEVDARKHKLTRASSDFEMLATVLMLGVIGGTYGSYYGQDEYDQLHLMGCGIDWSKWTGVHLDTWYEWQGTFAEDERTQKLATTLQCRCDREVRLSYGLEPPSLEAMFVSMSLDTIGRLYEI